MTLEGWLGAALALIGAIWAAFTRGKARGRAQERDAAMDRKHETRERMQDAIDKSHAGGAGWRDRLRKSKR